MRTKFKVNSDKTYWFSSLIQTKKFLKKLKWYETYKFQKGEYVFLPYLSKEKELQKLNYKLKLKQSFIDDCAWYLSISSEINFTGSTDSYSYSYDKNALSALDSFYTIESKGRKAITHCSEPEKLQILLHTKTAVSMQIKLWTEGRVDGTLPLEEFINTCKEFKVPKWVFIAVETQKWNYDEYKIFSSFKEANLKKIKTLY